VDGDAGRNPALVCVEATAGTVRWREPAFGSATVIAVNERLLVLTDSGEVVLAEADASGLKVLHRQQMLNGKCWTPMAFAGGHLFARNASGDIIGVAVR